MTVAATLEAPETTGHYERSIDERRYLHVLPRSVIAGLYDVHPWLPFGVITASINDSAYALGRALTAEDLRERRKRIRYRCHRSCSDRTDHRQRFEEDD
ncbi:hypothetical protein [Natronorubrum aibiense]|uniref:hypothetical protein n=1 Tax=Natronorubrum aibiense TaxID=348826 RepID=UPI001386FD7A|nr:hypothetical protein [Natronorubrum aibiense]